MNATTRPILTVEDLMERWGVGEETVIRHVRADGLRYLPLGRARAGRRPIYRFRLATVEAWERDQEQGQAPAQAQAEAPPPGRPAGYTGKIHTRSRTRPT